MMTMSAFFVASGFGNEWPSRIWWQTAKCSPSTSGVAAAPPGSSRSALSIFFFSSRRRHTRYLMKLRRDWDMRIVLLGAFEKFLRFLTGDAIQKTIRERQAAAGWIVILKGGRRVDPQNPSFRAAGIFPAVRRGAFKIQAIARFQEIVAVVVQPEFELAAQDMQEFLAFVGVGFAAAAAGFHAEEVRLHGGVAPGEKFHADLGAGFEDFALRGTHKMLPFTVRFEEGDDVGFVKTGDAAERGDRTAHLAALEGAEESDGNAGGAGDLGEGKFAAHPEAAKALAGKLRRVGGGGDDALFFEDVHDGRGIQAARTAEENGALQQADVGFGVHPITTLGALRRNEAEGFPGAQCRRGNRKPAGHFGNAQKGLRALGFRCAGQILSA